MGHPSDRHVPAVPTVDAVVALLADPATRAIVVLLGEEHARTATPLAVSEAPVKDATPRLLKDRLRMLRGRGIVEAVEQERAGIGVPTRWQLTRAGLDLYRVQALMTRVVMHATQLTDAHSARVRDFALGATLQGLADPVVLAIIDVLARQDGGLDPEALLLRCQPVPRRTLYRRLSLLVDQGVVTRTHSRSMPRTTKYAFVQRWRPVAAIPLLAAWWAYRHWSDPLSEHPNPQSELDRLLALVLPLVSQRAAGPIGAVTSWEVAEGVDAPSRLLTTAGGMALSAATAGGADDALVQGSASAWVQALVADRTDGLAFSGDMALGRSTVNVVRAALLAYVR